MRWPPYLLKLKIRNQDHDFALYLPLFLIWPVVIVFLLAIFLILLPFAILALIFTWRWGWLRSLLLAGPALFRLVGQLPGLEIDAGGKKGQVYIAFV
jgi:hypothetical protein